jgi:hypothetical protein
MQTAEKVIGWSRPLKKIDFLGVVIVRNLALVNRLKVRRAGNKLIHEALAVP